MTEATERTGRADLHIHTIASDGTASVTSVLERAVQLGLDVIAITDHERIDAAVAGRAIAQDRGLPVEVVVGEEVTTLGGHLLAHSGYGTSGWAGIARPPWSWTSANVARMDRNDFTGAVRPSARLRHDR